MKLNGLQTGLALSLLIHGAVVASLSLTGFLAHKASIAQDHRAVVLTLVAAPAEPPLTVEKTPAIQPVAVKPTPVLPEPKPIIPEPVKIPEPPEVKEKEPDKPVPAEIPAAIPPPAASTKIAKANPVQIIETVSAPPTTKVRGDGSSPTPGLDATTIIAPPAVKAEPNYLDNPEPIYPALARRRRQEGVVLMTVKVLADGTAVDVKLKQSSGFSLLDDSAMRAVRSWKFIPSRIGGRALDSDIDVPVRFQLMR